MNRPLIKICGLRRPEDIFAVNKWKPDYIGFLFVPGRKRSISYEEAAVLKQLLDPSIHSVGVFLDAPIEDILQAVSLHLVDLIQLHGKEDEAYLQRLREQLPNTPAPIPVIKAFSVQGAKDLEAAAKTTADYLLLDNHIPGSGQSFDWSLLSVVSRPYFLAGGLSPENISAALSVRPYGVDVSSGVETDGQKDPEKIADFIRQVRENSCM